MGSSKLRLDLPTTAAIGFGTLVVAVSAALGIGTVAGLGHEGTAGGGLPVSSPTALEPSPSPPLLGPVLASTPPAVKPIPTVSMISSPTPLASASPLSADSCRPEEVDVHLWTDQPTYTSGQTVWMRSYAHNHSPRACTLTFNSCTDRLTIIDRSGRTVFDEDPTRPGQQCYPKGQRLTPDQSTGISGLSWDQHLGCYPPLSAPTPCAGGQAPPGVYSVHEHWSVDLTSQFTIDG